MELSGKNLVAGRMSAEGPATLAAIDPARCVELAPRFHEATVAEVDSALEAACHAQAEYRGLSAEQRAVFLDAIAEGILALGDELLDRASAETGLGRERLLGERTRTVNQLRMFAELVREGSWVEASIDRAIPDRQPVPKPDLRRMLMPLGPVVVFGASNFPLAYSVAGGDTASALAAGNPVVVKAHPAHPGTSELVGRAVVDAGTASGMPAGVFSMVHGAGNEVGLALVEHPRTQGVGFTGSLRGGRALFDAAARRPRPIPVFAEMGSVNPVFILPRALRERGVAIAEQLKQAVTLGVGQFCTCPGLVMGLAGDEFSGFAGQLRQLVSTTSPGTMLHAGILRGYEGRLAELRSLPNVAAAVAPGPADPARTEALAAVLSTDASTLLSQRTLQDEVFGPSTVVVQCATLEQLVEVAERLEGHLTATIHGTDEDLAEYRLLVDVLASKAGRLIFNGVPTGVEVCPSMVHGGPYPATTDSRWTSVGTLAIKRFARPVCFQNCPPELLPEELRDENRRKLWRLVDGEWSR